MEKYIESDNY